MRTDDRDLFVQNMLIADLCNRLGQSLCEQDRHAEAFHLFGRAFVAVQGTQYKHTAVYPPPRSYQTPHRLPPLPLLPRP